MTIAKVKCPVCHAEVEWLEKNTYRPFCSKRCKQIDLGSWADEQYAVPLVGQTEHGEDDDMP